MQLGSRGTSHPWASSDSKPSRIEDAEFPCPTSCTTHRPIELQSRVRTGLRVEVVEPSCQTLTLLPQVAPLGRATWDRSQLNMGAVTTWEGDPMDTFWGLSATAWTAIYTLLTLGLLLVAVIAAHMPSASGKWRAKPSWKRAARM